MPCLMALPNELHVKTLTGLSYVDVLNYGQVS